MKHTKLISSLLRSDLLLQNEQLRLHAKRDLAVYLIRCGLKQKWVLGYMRIVDQFPETVFRLAVRNIGCLGQRRRTRKLIARVALLAKRHAQLKTP